MNDRELLELAAKAAGYTVDADGDRTDVRDNGGGPMRWNPLDDDGDAMRLANKLGLDVGIDPAFSRTSIASLRGGPACQVSHQAYPVEAATRRAIVTVAAELGGRK